MADTMPTATLSDTPRGLRAAAALLAAGELVAFPTETGYGLGAATGPWRGSSRQRTGRPSTR